MATTVTFYQVKDPMPATVDRTLAPLLEKVLESGHRVLVVCPSEQRMERINEALWTYKEESFLPHGLSTDVNAAEHPVLLALVAENKNAAGVLVRVSGAEIASVEGFERVLDIFEGNENQLEKARARWKYFKAQGAEMAYFEHTGTGWQKKL